LSFFFGAVNGFFDTTKISFRLFDDEADGLLVFNAIGNADGLDVFGLDILALDGFAADA